MGVYNVGGTVNSGMPLIGYNNAAIAGNSVVVTGGLINQFPGFPYVNLWDGSASTLWYNVATDQYPASKDVHFITYLGAGIPVSYIAIANHNFGDKQVVATVELASDTPSFGDKSMSALLHFGGTDGSTTFTDSTGRHTFTANGNAQIDNAQSKFGGTAGLFDGTGDFLDGDGSLDFVFGVNDFTIDYWFRPNVDGTSMVIYEGRDLTGGATNFVTIYRNPGNKMVFFGAGADRITSTTNIVAGAWYHIALTRSGTSSRLFINGTQEGGTFSDSNSYQNGAARPRIGADNFGNDRVNGWIDELRIVKGFAMWTANFTPPTAAYNNEFVKTGSNFTFTDNSPAIIRFPLSSAYLGVRLRLNAPIMEDDPVSGVAGKVTTAMTFYPAGGTAGGTDWRDLGGHLWTANGNAQIAATNRGFALVLDGTGDFLTGDGYNDFAFGTGDFTIDFFVWFSSAAGFSVLYDGRPTGVDGFYPTIYHDGSTNLMHYFVNGLDRIIGTQAIGIGAWHHIAVTRSGTSTRMFVNGVQDGPTFVDSSSYVNGTSRPTIGGNGIATGTAQLTGFIDDLRVLNGRAKWTANFTIPTRGLTWNDQDLRAGIEYVGNLLELERSIRVDVDHVPMPYGRRTTVVNGMSESGQFLGRIVLGEWRESKAQFSYFTPSHYRAVIDPFLASAQEFPFFWSWKPATYPNEVSFGWLINNAEPATDPVSQRVHLDLEMRGTAT